MCRTLYLRYFDLLPMVYLTPTHGILKPSYSIMNAYPWPWVGGRNTMGREFIISLEGVRYTTDRWSKYHGYRVRYTMCRGFDIPRLGGKHIMGKVFDIPLFPVTFWIAFYTSFWYFDILNLLPMVYRTPYPWYLDPLTHGILTPYPSCFKPRIHGILNPRSIYHG
jgi:hypothetical protein